MKVQGLNFFPFPARLDDKVNLITLEYGAKGLGVYTMIMSQIFGGCGYYMPVEKIFNTFDKEKTWFRCYR